MARRQVVHFYDTHPITASQVLARLGELGRDLGSLAPSDLFDHDQDHYGGLAANDALIAAAEIDPESRVLDICAGIGGPARYVAVTTRAQVTGLDLTESRVAGAAALTDRVGLDRQVRFLRGDAQALPLASGAFDAAISQEAWLHVPDKAAVLAEAFRVLRPGGVLAFTDWTSGPGFEGSDAALMAETFAAVNIPTEDTYAGMMAAAGFQDVLSTDLTAERVPILQERLSMYERLRQETIDRTGVDSDRTYCEHYARFVHLAEIGEIGGARFVGRKPDGAPGRA